MRIDEAGQHGCTREIDHIGAGWNGRGGGIRDAFDAIAADENDLVATRGIGFAVDERTGADDRERVQHGCGFVFLGAVVNHNCKEEEKYPPRVLHSLAPRIRCLGKLSAFYAWEEPITASASISTSISGEIRALTWTIDVAGRTSRK